MQKLFHVRIQAENSSQSMSSFINLFQSSSPIMWIKIVETLVVYQVLSIGCEDRKIRFQLAFPYKF